MALAEVRHPSQLGSGMRRTRPLSVQLVLIFVGLLAGMAAVLTTAAQRTLLANLAADANRHVSLAARTREQTLTQLFQLRQQRAQGFLASLEALCAEPLDSGRLAWSSNCVRPMLDDFRKSERALGSALIYRQRTVRRSGRRVAPEMPAEKALARVLHTPEGGIEYVMRVTRRQSALTIQFDHEEVAKLFDDQPPIGRRAEVFLLDEGGRFLNPSPKASAKPAAAHL